MLVSCPWCSEWVLWLLAAVAGGTAWLVGRSGADGMARPMGWGSFILFTMGAGFWMFSDTYAYYYAEKESALRFSYWGSYREHQMWGEIIQAFRQRYPEIGVKREYITDRYSEKIQQLLLADEAPDVMMFQDEPFPRFVSSGKFEALDAYCRQPDRPLDLENHFFKTSVLHFQVDGRTYGIPVFGGNCLILYNRDAFREAGLPEPPDRWTMDEFLATCRRITADTNADGRMDRYAFLVPSWVYWMPFHFAYGGRYLDRTRRYWRLWGPEAETSFAFWQDLRHRHHVAPHRDELGETGGVAFMTGRVAMQVNGPWAMPPLNAAGVSYDVAHTPSGPGGRATRVTWDALVMFSGSRKKDQAWKFIHFALGLEAQEIVARYQRSIPALKAAGQAFIDANPEVRAGRFIEALEYSRFQPITVDWALMSREVASETDLMLDDRQTPRQTLLDLVRNVHLSERFIMPRAGSAGESGR